MSVEPGYAMKMLSWWCKVEADGRRQLAQSQQKPAEDVSLRLAAMNCCSYIDDWDWAQDYISVLSFSTDKQMRGSHCAVIVGMPNSRIMLAKIAASCK